MDSTSISKIEKLVDKLKKMPPNEKKNYNEANTKNGFIQPFFQALGWDFANINEVEAEKQIVKGRADFLLKYKGIPKMCIEAKPLRAQLSDDDRKQAITYAYHKGMTWAVLTNFESLQVLNAEIETSDVNQSIFINLKYKDYITELEDIALLSKESFKTNKLDKKAAKYGKIPLRIPIEKRLYQHLKDYREKFFNDIYLMNKKRGVTLQDTDSLIQTLFNRLLFIRTAEDRNIAADYNLLSALHIWKDQPDRERMLIDDIRDIFKGFVKLYDSDLFPLIGDRWEHIWVDNQLLYDFIRRLYEVPNDFAKYDFAIIDADVLGQVYEQYLGYIAQIAKQKAKEQQLRLEMGLPVNEEVVLEKKKRARKTSGIYYTPKWVTDYIVKETIRKVIEENGNDIDSVRKLKILDPACGSGSFLIRAYDELLNYYDNYSTDSTDKSEPASRIKILIDQIHGVDLDQHAIEITRLNLLIRALAKAELLPPLARNIQCGNSLISGNSNQLKQWFGKDYRKKNPVFWKEQFKEIMGDGGFDIIIGNPPYVNESRSNKELFRELKNVPLLQTYYEKNMDLFNYFIEISIDLLKEGGFLGFIIPSYWQDRTGATLLRRKIIDQTKIEHVVDLKDFKVFPGAPGQHNNIIILRKVAKRNDDHTFIYREFLEASSETLGEAPILTEPKIESYALIENKLIIGADTLAIIDKIKKQNVFYLESSEVIRGVDTGPGRYNGKGVFLLNEWEYAELSESLSDDICTYFFKPFFEAHQLDRYHFQEKNKYWLLYADNVRKKRLENGDSDCQLIIDHLDQFTANITSSNKPYGLHRAKQEKYFTSANKLMFVRKTKYPKFVPVPEPYFVDEAAYMIIMDSDKYSELYLASILNSSLAKWFFSTQKKHGEQLQIDKEQILVFPIYEIDFDNPSNKASYEKLVGLATNMLKLHKELYELNTTSADIIGDITQELKTKIENMDKKINGIICGLYNIVKNEQAIIEFSRTELNLSEVYD